jgi:phospholipase C
MTITTCWIFPLEPDHGRVCKTALDERSAGRAAAGSDGACLAAAHALNNAKATTEETERRRSRNTALRAYARRGRQPAGLLAGVRRERQRKREGLESHVRAGFSRRLGVCAVVAAGIFAGCAGPVQSTAPLARGVTGQAPEPQGLHLTGAGSGVIQHVIVIVQENRSFDNLFQGYPGANTVSSGINSLGQTVPLVPVGLEGTYGLDHNANSFFTDCDGASPGQDCKNDAFDLEGTYGQNIPQNAPYAYVPHSETKPYFEMADQYVLGDAMFTSHIDASFVSHQYIIAGQASGAVNLPTTLWGCGGGSDDTVATLNADRSYGPSESPCFTNTTIGNELDAKGLPWRYYASGPNTLEYIWSAYQAISNVYNGPDWTNDVITPPSQFLTDVGNGTLGAVTWITPSWFDSDHATAESTTGPDWVASLVNAVGESSFWNTSAIFVMWDEWGGWYDHVPPPYEDYDGLGMRVPLLIVSPYAKKHYVSHVQYEHGSILRFIEDVFGLPRLAASDTRANSPAGDCFVFNAPPRAFRPIKARHDARYFRAQPNDPRAPDEE